jgi:orotidine-5'-phosphate decarboxylase
MTKQGLVEAIALQNSYLCVGLDTDITKLPAHLPATAQGVVAFNKAIIDATKAYCVSYKINTAFYESMGVAGWQAMEETLAYIPSTHFTIADAKRGDIGNTSSHYAKTFFETLSFDAITVAPYMGEDSIRPFLEYEHKTTIVLGLTSNKGADNFQQTFVTPLDENLSLVPHLMFPNHPRKLYEQVLETVSSWGTPDNLMFVIGATQAAELENVRRIIPNHFLLVPGVGFQGGSLADVTHYGANRELGLLVNVSRAILYASGEENFAEEAAAIAQQYQVEMAPYIAANQQKYA